MVIQDESSLEDALMLVEQGPVRYSDRFAYTVVSSRAQLEKSATAALSRGEIAIVVPRGEEKTMEDYSQTFNRIKAQRKKDEARSIREWVAAHPEVKKASTEADIIRIYRNARKEELGG